MGYERGSGSLLESPPESERSTKLDIESFYELAAKDARLQKLSEEILEAIDTYVEAKRRHTAYLKDDIAKQREPERYKERSEKIEDDRYSAHNDLIAAVHSFAKRCQKMGFDTTWWDGPDGLSRSNDYKTTRGKIDDWAMEFELAKDDEDT
jgi:exonuclease VII large subunit